MVTPATTIAPAPSDAPSFTRISPNSQSSSLLSEPSGLMARGSRSLVKMTCGPTNTPLSNVTPWYMLARFCIFTLSPICTPKSTYAPLPSMQLRPSTASSRTCAWCQILVPGPSVALGDTSAVGWMYMLSLMSKVQSPKSKVQSSSPPLDFGLWTLDYSSYSLGG